MKELQTYKLKIYSERKDLTKFLNPNLKFKLKTVGFHVTGLVVYLEIVNVLSDYHIYCNTDSIRRNTFILILHHIQFSFDQ